MTGTITKGRIMRQDLDLYDGRSLDTSRPDPTGGALAGHRIGDAVDVLMVYGAGMSQNGGAIQAAINAVGSSSRALSLAPGTWDITTNLTVPSNVALVLAAGAVLTPATGITMTVNGPLFRHASTYTGGAGTVTVNGFDSMASTTSVSEYAADTGTADAYAMAPSPVWSSYTTGGKLRFKAANANTGSSTLAVSGLAPQTLKKNNDVNLVSGDIEAGQIVEVVYDGTNFQVISELGNQTAYTGVANTFSAAQTFSSTISATAFNLGGYPLSLVKIESATSISSQASVDFETGFSATYFGLLFLFFKVTPATDTASLIARVKVGGSYAATGYVNHTATPSAAATTYAANNSVTSGISLSLSQSNAFSYRGLTGFALLLNPSVSTIPWMRGLGSYVDSTTANIQGIIGGGYTSSATVEGVRFMYGTGNIASGDIIQYGILA